MNIRFLYRILSKDLTRDKYVPFFLLRLCMLKSKEIKGLLVCVFTLVIVSWSKLLFTGNIKVDSNPLSTFHGILVIILFSVSLFTYGRVYSKFYKNAADLTISHRQLKIYGYIHIVLASLMLPILSNDIFLYLAYGDLSNMGHNVFTSQDVMMQSKWASYVGNWKDSPYLYGPLTLWISKITNWIGGSNIFMVLGVFKIIWALIAICFLEIMSLTVKNMGDFILVLFTPVFWLQNVAGIHFDLMAAFFLLISVYFITQQKIVFSLVAISIACMCKIVFVIFIPFVLLHYFFINPNRITWKPIVYFLVGVILSVGVVLLSYYPYWKGMQTITVPFKYLSDQEPSKSFSEVLGEIFNAIFEDKFHKNEITNMDDSFAKIWWWKQLRIAFNIIGFVMAIVVSIVFIVKTKFVFYKTVLAEYWIKLSLVFFFFYSHIFNAWYLIALLPFLPLIGNNERLKKYFVLISVFSCLHMIFLNIGRDSFAYYLLPPIIFINISLFLWQFKKNFLTVESHLIKEV